MWQIVVLEYATPHPLPQKILTNLGLSKATG